MAREIKVMLFTDFFFANLRSFHKHSRPACKKLRLIHIRQEKPGHHNLGIYIAVLPASMVFRVSLFLDHLMGLNVQKDLDHCSSKNSPDQLFLVSLWANPVVRETVGQLDFILTKWVVRCAFRIIFTFDNWHITCISYVEYELCNSHDYRVATTP